MGRNWFAFRVSLCILRSSIVQWPDVAIARNASDSAWATRRACLAARCSVLVERSTRSTRAINTCASSSRLSTTLIPSSSPLAIAATAPFRLCPLANRRLRLVSVAVGIPCIDSRLGIC
jgi:hypothetical protein